MIFILIFFILYGSCQSLAQPFIYPLEQTASIRFDSVISKKTANIHSSFKPLLPPQAGEYFQPLAETVGTIQRSFFYRKLKKESLIILDGGRLKPQDTVITLPGDYYITADPLFHFETGKDFGDTSARADTSRLYRNTRGFLIRGQVGGNLVFETSFLENQAVLPAYRDEFVRNNKVAPGSGRIKPFKNTGYDFAMAGGYFMYHTGLKKSDLDISFGHGKHFIGGGYRSVLLSDNTFNYPFLRIAFGRGIFQYTAMYAVWQNMYRQGNASGAEGIFQRKVSTIHYLNILAGKTIEVGFFESLISRAAGNTGKMILTPYVYNPLIGLNTMRFGFASAENAMIGVNMKIKISNRIKFYDQFAVDDLSKGKYAMQGGVKIINPFGIRTVLMQTEVNYVTPFTYAHSDSLQAYTHYNQPAAHPLGAGFFESVSILYLNFHDFFSRFQYNYITYYEDFGNFNFGKNIFRSDETETYTPDVPEITRINYFLAETGYILNPVTNMQVCVGAVIRSERNSAWEKQTKYLYFTFRTSLSNLYWDF
ncbi:MAG: hypothetical protein HYY40_06240 [Bacteroidetes bacterium]|nr:hypothetical protein [Bacteroidota bacterium]